MSGVIDFHTHAFADDLAERAMASLSHACKGVTPCHDGRLSSLLKSMDIAGIEKSVVCPIATKPKQFEGIFSWCQQIRSERIIPFPSIHPDDPLCLERIQLIKNEGFKGIKMHPYYQDYVIDDPKLSNIYKIANELGLIVVVHTGHDIAFEFDDRTSPERVAAIYRDFPDLKFIATHFGGWAVWDEVEKYLIGKPIYMEISFSLTYLEKVQARRMLINHPPKYLLFGTDSPWQDQKLTIQLLKEMELPAETEDLILWGNAKRLLSEI